MSTHAIFTLAPSWSSATCSSPFSAGSSRRLLHVVGYHVMSGCRSRTVSQVRMQSLSASWPSRSKLLLWAWIAPAPAFQERIASSAISSYEMGVWGFISVVRTPLMCDSMTTGESQVGSMSAYLSRAVATMPLLRVS